MSASLSLVDGTSWTYLATQQCADWLDEFASVLSLPESTESPSSESWSIHVCSPTEIDACLSAMQPEGKHSRRFDLGPLQVHAFSGARQMAFEVSDSPNRHNRLMSQWYSQYPLYPALMKAGNLPIHAGLSLFQDRGVLFAAPGGTGKSTAMRRLPADWTVLCDDESWLVEHEGHLFAHPMPTWSDLVLRNLDQTWPTQNPKLVHSIVFLRQSDGVSLKRLNHATCANYLKQAVEQILRRAWTVLPPPDMTEVRIRVFERSEEMARSLNGFLLDLNLTDPFWPELQAQLLHTEP